MQDQDKPKEKQCIVEIGELNTRVSHTTRRVLVEVAPAGFDLVQPDIEITNRIVFPGLFWEHDSGEGTFEIDLTGIKPFQYLEQSSLDRIRAIIQDIGPKLPKEIQARLNWFEMWMSWALMYCKNPVMVMVEL